MAKASHVKLPVVSAATAIRVDYGLSLSEMLATGDYDLKTVDIAPHRIVLEGNGVVEFEAAIFHFDREIPSDEAVMLIYMHDSLHRWEPARIEHLLAYAAHDVSKHSTLLVALGHRDDKVGQSRVAYLQKRASKRLLYFLSWVVDWSNDDGFLAVRKKTST